MDNLSNILKDLSLFIYKATNEEFNASQASVKENINELFGIDLVKMATIHIKYITIITYSQKILLFKCPKLRNHMQNMVSLATITFINEYTEVGYECGYFPKGTIQLLDNALKTLLARIRPQIIPIVENLIPHSDNYIMSAIGNSYGDIYETHLEWAKGSKMN